MNNDIQFESVVENGIIRIPEQYMKNMPSAAKVTVSLVMRTRPKIKPKTKARPSSIDEFPAVLHTKDWKFNREEANER
jgi:hypothetical protein